MSIHKKLMQARLKLQTADLKKSGHNKFAGYKYFELGDFYLLFKRFLMRLVSVAQLHFIRT